MEIEKLSGTDTRLYQLVAPLVLDPDVLKYNNNYPFKTSRDFVWFLALENDVVKGFIPVEFRDELPIINNYYIKNDDLELLAMLLKTVLEVYGSYYTITSVTQIQHLQVFEDNGFQISREWKKYVKMEKERVYEVTGN